MLEKIFENLKSDLLTDDIKNQIETIFEAAIKEKADTKIEELEKQFEDYKEQEIKKLEEKSTEYEDSYLVNEISTYFELAIEEFFKENKLAIENGIKAEQFDNLIESMKKVFTDNFIKIDEAKGLEKIEDGLNKSKEDNNKLTREIADLKNENKKLKALVEFNTISKDLSEPEKEKLEKLAEDYNLDDLDSYKTKVTILKEKIIKGDENVDSENVDSENDEINDDVVDDSKFKANTKKSVASLF